MYSKTIFGMSILVAMTTLQTVAHAQTPESQTKAITRTTCKDYMEMDETVKPKFIFYTEGYSKHGKPTSTAFDVIDIDKMKPVLDEYCRVNLSASAYQKIMKDSMASETAKK